jgi:hypothetical protein
VTIACSRFIALRTASAPMPSAWSSARHWATIRGLMRRSSISPKRGSTRFSQTRTCWSTVSGWMRARASATHTGQNEASSVVPSGSSPGGAGAYAAASSARRARSKSACSRERQITRSRRPFAS